MKKERKWEREERKKKNKEKRTKNKRKRKIKNKKKFSTCGVAQKSRKNFPQIRIS